LHYLKKLTEKQYICYYPSISEQLSLAKFKSLESLDLYAQEPCKYL